MKQSIANLLGLDNKNSIWYYPAYYQWYNCPTQWDSFFDFNMEEIKQETISIPTPKTSYGIERIRQKIAQLFKVSYTELRERRKRFNFQNLKYNKKFLYLVAFFIIIVFVLAIAAYFGEQENSVANESERPQPTVAKISIKLNKVFNFPIRDDKGKEVNKVRYEIESAGLYDSIIVKGQRARAVKGRTFLIFNLKLLNQYNKAIEINTKDYIRLSVNNKNEFVAPDIHNDPVEVQAISTKYTRVGFAINENDKNYTVQVGEIDGRKESIKLSLK